MKAEKLLHLTLDENGYDEFVTKGSGFSHTIVEAMERYAKDYHESKVKKLNNVSRLCVCLPLAQGFNLPTNLMGQIAQNRCYRQ